MNKSILVEIEEVLNELIKCMPEREYIQFIENDDLLNIYDRVASLENPEGILTDEILNKILNLVKAKLDLYN